jgi:glucose 1-dehydrogenase
MRFKGKTVIVTGAAQGIGLGCAKRFAEEGARVAVVDRNEEAGRKSAAGLKDAAFFACDVGLKPEVDRTIADVIGRFGQIDVLVNNAGIVRPKNLLEMSEEDFDLVIRTNLKSTFLFTQGVARHMIERGIKGAIVNMSSTHTAYASSKGGISSMTKAVSLSLAPHGIRVNAIGPGTIETDMTARLLNDPKSRGSILARTPLGRFGTTADVAGVIAFLASDDAAYLTGQTIYLEGGRMGLNYVMPTAI